jgi:hypothetical protein
MLQYRQQQQQGGSHKPMAAAAGQRPPAGSSTVAIAGGSTAGPEAAAVNMQQIEQLIMHAGMMLQASGLPPLPADMLTLLRSGALGMQQAAYLLNARLKHVQATRQADLMEQRERERAAAEAAATAEAAAAAKADADAEAAFMGGDNMDD